MRTTNEILNWVLTHPRREPGEHGGWGGWDGSLLVRLNVAPVASSVRALAKSQGELFPLSAEAPVSAVHFFLVEPYGHAVVDVCGGGTTVLEARGVGLSYTSVEEIQHRGLIYLGWAYFRNGALT